MTFDLKRELKAVDRWIESGALGMAVQALRNLEASMAGAPELRLVRAELLRRAANLLQRKGNLPAAQKCREDARDLARESEGDDDVRRCLEALLLSDTGLGLEALADRDGAAQAWETALSLATSGPGCPDEVLAPVLVNASAGAMIRASGPASSSESLATARRLAQRAIEVATRHGDPDLLGRAQANAQLVQGLVPSASLAAGTHDSPADLRLQSVLNQHTWHIKHRSFQAASVLLEGEIETAERAGRIELVVTFYAELARQRLAWSRSLAEIRAAATKAIAPLEGLRESAGPFGVDTQHLRNAADLAYQTLGFALLTERHVDEAFDLLERGRARRLSKDQLDWTSSAEGLPLERRRLVANVHARIRRATARALGRDRRSPRRDLIYAAQREPDDTPIAQSPAKAGTPPEVQEAHGELADVMRSLFRDFPQPFRGERMPFLSLAQAQSALRRSEIVLYPVEALGRLLLMTVTPEEVRVTEIAGDAGTDSLVALLERCREGLSRPSTDLAALRGALADLGARLLGPIEPSLNDGRTTLLWCPPAGPLSTIPLAALRLGGRWIAERWQTVHLPMTALIATASARQRTSPLVALGNPEENLSAAALEVSDIQAIYPGDVAVGAKATPEFLRAHALSGGIAHLACHGLFERDLPGLSKLLLAPVDEEGRGLVFASDIAAFGFDLSLVVLSACQSALVGGSGAEEIGGFGLAFLLHGAESVVAGLWDVSDHATRALMARFYGHLTANPKGEALRLATVDLLGDGRYEHPCFWSPFVLMGDWRGTAKPRTL
jgi:CHAT domain-containing protein